MAKRTYTRIFREQFVSTWLWHREETTLSAHCDRFGVSRQTAYDWIAKYGEQGMAGLETKSCAPLTVPHRTDDEIVKLLISAREHRPTWGPTHDAFQQEREAAGKWVRAQLTSAQLPTYFVGVQEQFDTRKAVEAQRGADFNLKAYHDQVLSYGAPPVRFVRELMLDQPVQ